MDRVRRSWWRSDRRLSWIARKRLRLCGCERDRGRQRVCGSSQSIGPVTVSARSIPLAAMRAATRDIGELADHLGLDRFAVIGHSSGGPNAAASARFLSDRLTGCAIVSGPAPPEAEISKHEVMRQNRIAQRLQVMAPRLMSAAWRAGLRQAQRAPDKALAYLRRTLPASDVAVIAQPDIAAGLRDSLCAARCPVRPATRRSKTFK